MCKIINGLLALVVLATAGSCVNKSIEVNKQLAPLKQEFIETAKQAPSKAYTDGIAPDGRTIVKFDYNGALDKVVAERDAYASQISGCTPGKWKVVDYVDSTSMSPAVCYNPFAKIPKYQGK